MDFFTTPKGRDTSPSEEDTKLKDLPPGTQGMQGRGTSRIPDDVLGEDVPPGGVGFDTNDDDPNDNPDDDVIPNPGDDDKRQDRIRDSMYVLGQTVQAMGLDPEDFPFDDWGGIPDTEQGIDGLRQRIVDQETMEILCTEVLNEDSYRTGSSEFVQFLRDQHITKVQDIMTLRRQEFKDYYGYDISVVHYRRIQAFAIGIRMPETNTKLTNFPV